MILLTQGVTKMEKRITRPVDTRCCQLSVGMGGKMAKRFEYEHIKVPPKWSQEFIPCRNQSIPQVV